MSCNNDKLGCNSDKLSCLCTTCRILLLARFISALSELSSHLHQCVICHAEAQDSQRKYGKKTFLYYSDYVSLFFMF